MLKNKVAQYPLEGCAHVININLNGVFFGMQQQIAAMLKIGGGSAPSSIWRLSWVRCAAKHGVVGLTQAAALEA